MANDLNAILIQKIDLSPELAILRVVPDGWDLPDFMPGQFAVLGLPGSAQRCEASEPEEQAVDSDKLIKRAFSVASSPSSKEYIEFYVVMVTSGSLTPRLFALKIGDRLWLSQKVTGAFTLQDTPPDKHVVLISTGTGLAPYLSMLRTQFTCGGERKVAVLHGVRHSWDLGYRSELINLDRMCPNFTYIPMISRPKNENAPWGGATGYVQHHWGGTTLTDAWGFKPSPEDTHVFICGNPAMIEDLVEKLEGEGFKQHQKKAPGQIHFEKYW